MWGGGVLVHEQGRLVVEVGEFLQDRVTKS